MGVACLRSWAAPCLALVWSEGWPGTQKREARPGPVLPGPWQLGLPEHVLWADMASSGCQLRFHICEWGS